MTSSVVLMDCAASMPMRTNSARVYLTPLVSLCNDNQGGLAYSATHHYFKQKNCHESKPCFSHGLRYDHFGIDGVERASSRHGPSLGSLTTPPCSEGVNWMVLKKPITLGADQIKAFRRIYNANARPIQATNDRVIKESM